MFRGWYRGKSIKVMALLVVIFSTGSFGLNSAYGSENNQFGVGPELEQPRRYFIEGSPKSVKLFDVRYQHVVPFTGEIERVENGVWVSTPELPQGDYRIDWEGGSKSFSIKGKHSYDPIIVESNGIWLLLLGGGFTTALLIGLFLKIRGKSGKVSLASFALILFISGGGAVVSMDSSKPLPNIDRCLELSMFKEYLDCVFPSMFEVANKQPDRLDEYLKKQIPNSHCHDAAHYVGFESYRRDLNIINASQRATTSCVYGVIHGTTEAIAVFSSDEDFPKNALKFCNLFEDGTVREYCVHGAGHATVMRTNGDLERALELCGPLTNNDHRCVGPALMEWMVWRNEIKDPVKAKERLGGPEEPLEICLDLERDSLVRAACYEALHLANIKEPSKSIDWCLNVEKDFAVECFAGIGKDLHFWATFRTPVAQDLSVAVDIHKMCERANSDKARYECTWHLVRNAGVVIQDYDKLDKELCLAIPINHLTACRESVAAVKVENKARLDQI